MVKPDSDTAAPKEAKTTKPVRKTVAKKASSAKKAVAPKSAKPKSGDIALKARSPPAKPGKGSKAKPKATVARAGAAPGFPKIETLVLEAISVEGTEEKPYVGGVTIAKYVLDYDDRAQAGQVTRRVKQALTSLIGKKILRVKRDSYALTAVGKEKAPQAQTRTKVVRPAEGARDPKGQAAPKARITLSGRASRPVVLPD
jgi:hypothetical protein